MEVKYSKLFPPRHPVSSPPDESGIRVIHREPRQQYTAAGQYQPDEMEIIMALATPTLNEGEIYIGAIISADGTRNHHLILLPGAAEKLNWKDANTWAESIGGELPDRVEGALLFAHAKDQFEQDWYWTREQHAAYSDNAWYQSFSYGSQIDYDTYDQLRARAVRRLVIE